MLNSEGDSHNWTASIYVVLLLFKFSLHHLHSFFSLSCPSLKSMLALVFMAAKSTCSTINNICPTTTAKTKSLPVVLKPPVIVLFIKEKRISLPGFSINR